MRLGYKTTMVLLAFVLATASFQFMGGRAYAADFAGGGTSGNPYLIQTAEQLDKVRDYLNLNVYFRMTNDIDLSGYSNWTPIGVDFSYSFAGSFDGGGHTITGLTISAPEEEEIGLFGITDQNSIISNLNLEEAVIEGGFAVGGLVGTNNGIIRNSSFSGDVLGENAVGGLVGYNLGDMIENSHTTGTVYGVYAVGGLVGKSTGYNSTIADSSSAATVSGPNDIEEAGGLIGTIEDGTITGSNATGAVNGGNRATQVGGLVGRIMDTVIHNSSATGNVSGRSRIGGLIGTSFDSSISESHATGNILGRDRVGGLIGSSIRGTIDDSYATGQISVTSGSGTIGGLIGDDVEGIIRNSHASGDVIGDAATDSAGGLIGYSQSGNISGSSASGDVSGNWQIGGLIGSLYDGGEVESSFAAGNVYGLGDSQSIGGLIGENAGEIRNSYALGDVSTTAGSDSYYTGGLIGFNDGGILSSFATGQVSGQRMTGGLIGYHITADIQGSFASGDVSGTTDTGGLLGYHVNSLLINSYASGDVLGTNNVGGLVATLINATVSKSYASGNVGGNSFVRGLISIASDLTVINSFYDSEASGVSVSAGGVGKLTAEMQTAETYEADAANSWDFSSVWAIDSAYNGGYPYLRNVQAFLDFDDNGATGGSVPDTRSYMPGTAVVIDEGDDPVIRTDYLLQGWNTQADGNGVAYLSGDVYIVAANATLYAMWLAISSDATLTSSIGTVSSGGTVNETITDVPYGTTLAELRVAITPAAYATFEFYEADGTTLATTLTSGTQIIVTAQDGSTRVTYTVTVALSNEKALTAFSLPQQTGVAVIDAVAHTIEIEVAYGTDLSNLIATFTSSAGSTVSVNSVLQVSGTTANNFTAPVVYEVQAADGSTQSWTVTVTTAASNEKALTAFSLPQQTGAATIDTTAHTIEIEVVYGTDLSNLIATFTSSVGSSVSINGVPQVSGTTANDFTTPVTYTVTAQDGTSVSYTVAVLVKGLPVLNKLTLSAGGVALNADSIIGTVFRYRVGYQIAAINVMASVSDSNISIAGQLYDSDNGQVGGPINFISEEESLPLAIGVGDNRLELAVTDAHGASQTYQIYVHRTHAGYSNAQLHSLQLSGNLLQYERNRLEYSISVDNQVDRITVTAVPDENGAQVRINDENISTKIVTLATGQNIITIRVTAEDGTTMLTYRITITRATAPTTGVGGGPFGPIGPVTTGTIDAKQGGALTLLGVRIEVPADSMDGTIHVTVNSIDDPSVRPSSSTLHLISSVYEIIKNRAGLFNKPVTITLPFDTSKLDTALTTAGLYGLDQESGQWVLLDNQVVDYVNGTVSGDAHDFTIYAVLKSDLVSEPPVETPQLTDITGHWAETNILEFVQLGVLQGYPDHTFRPDAPITRAEFVRILVTVLQLQANSGPDFKDVQTHWARNEIRIAAALGIVNGYNNETFAPDDLITREQMAAIIVRALQIKEVEAINGFKDDADISDWARAAISTVVAHGLLNGYEDGTMQPASRATRAEAVTVIVRALKLD